MPYIDFQEVKRQVTIEQAAQMLGLDLKREQHQLRGACPACNGEPRSLAITPQKQMFYCFAGKTGGDCIALVSHVTGVDVKEAAEFLFPLRQSADAGKAHSSPSPRKSDTTAPPQRRPATQKEASFDPAALAQRLTYTDQVSALGISEDDAQRLRIGFHASAGLMRGRVCFPIRNPDGSIAGFIGWNGSDLKVPSTWLAGTNVVRLPKRA